MSKVNTAGWILANKSDWENDYPVIKTGFNVLDNMAVVLREGCLSLVAGRPSMGKTMFAVNVALNVAKSGRKAYYVSLRDSAVWIVSQLTDLGVSGNEMENILIDDPIYSPLQARELVAVIRSNCPDAALIVIDDIQTFGIANIQWLYGAFPNSAVLLLSQASREVEERSEHRVCLSDIRNFEQYGQYIEYAFSLYRHDYYYWEEGRNDLMELICLKSRESKGTFCLKKIGYALRDDIMSCEEER